MNQIGVRLDQTVKRLTTQNGKKVVGEGVMADCATGIGEIDKMIKQLLEARKTLRISERLSEEQIKEDRDLMALIRDSPVTLLTTQSYIPSTNGSQWQWTAGPGESTSQEEKRVIVAEANLTTNPGG
jgi:hypothetical protein